MFFTKDITEHKLGSYTDDPNLAKTLGFNIKLESIDNVACISLGSRILRAETAALNLLSIVLYEMEE